MAFYLHAQLGDIKSMMEFLKEQESNKQFGSDIHFDVDYALNILKDKLNIVNNELKEIQGQFDLQSDDM